MHDHSFLTSTLYDNILVTGGKEGGEAENAHGLNCSLKSCDLKAPKQGGAVQPEEHGFPRAFVWAAQVVGEKMVVCVSKRGPSLEFWNLT